VKWGEELPQSFFNQKTEALAYALLGTVLVHDSPNGLTAGRIVEVEMYRGVLDRAAHSFRGIPTSRTRVMFGPPGYAYVYFIYGMHYCLNVVAAANGVGEAILLRALEPLEGIELMADRRRQTLSTPPRISEVKRLTNGPAKLAQAMGITLEQYGWSLFNSPLSLFIGQSPVPRSLVARGPRINVQYAGESADFEWRFWLKGNSFVWRL
jgi:DNA-3-methyladenine glycosylase